MKSLESCVHLPWHATAWYNVLKSLFQHNISLVYLRVWILCARRMPTHQSRRPFQKML